MDFLIDEMRFGYHDLAHEILEFGTYVPENKTTEILGFNLCLTDPTTALPLKCGRKPHIPIGAVEAAQLIGGISRPEVLNRVSPNFQQFMDGNKFHGAYGPRVRSHIGYIIDELTRDPSSRRALVNIWNKFLDEEPGMHDYPCTCILQFFIRNNKLEMQVYMRSNDFWRGLAYDVFQFTQLQMSIAEALGIEPGFYRHTAGSMHIYDSDLDDVHAMLEASISERVVLDYPPAGGLTPTEAIHILDGGELKNERPITEWYHKHLDRYVRPASL